MNLSLPIKLKTGEHGTKQKNNQYEKIDFAGKL